MLVCVFMWMLIWEGQRGHQCILTVIVPQATFVQTKSLASGAADPRSLSYCISHCIFFKSAIVYEHDCYQGHFAVLRPAVLRHFHSSEQQLLELPTISCIWAELRAGHCRGCFWRAAADGCWWTNHRHQGSS